jgi:hypothetical protein
VSDRTPRAPERPTTPAGISPAEKLMCEWEARHDVAARGRRVDPAAALHRYMTRIRIEEDRRHREAAEHRAEAPGARSARRRDAFAARHPLAATWLRWGEDAG